MMGQTTEAALPKAVIQTTESGPRTGKNRAPSQVEARLYDEKYQAPSAKDMILTTRAARALRSHQLWLTLTYLGLLVLMGRGLAG